MLDILLYLVNIGYGVTLAGVIIFVATAFRQSILWGLGCLFFPPIAIIFLSIYWQEAKIPFFMWLVGIGLILISIILGS